MTPRDEELIYDLMFERRCDVLAAAYTVYERLTPINKKPISQKDFRELFIENWEIFSRLESKKQENI